MFKTITIRRMNDPAIRELMRASNKIELGLKHFKKFIKARQEFRIAVKKDFFGPSQKQVDKIFGDGNEAPRTLRSEGAPK